MTDAQFVHAVRNLTGLHDVSTAELLRIVEHLHSMLFDTACRDNSRHPQVGPLPGSIEARIAEAVVFEMRHC